MSDMTSTMPAAEADSASRFYVLEHHPENSTALGFWLYLMSDCLVFACLFATYAVLGRNYAGGPTGAELFDLPLVAVNTSLLLLSSITYGFAMLEMQHKRLRNTLLWLGVTGLLGACFIGFEMYEFVHLIHEGAGPQRSGFLTAFFTLVATHGLHVTFGGQGRDENRWLLGNEQHCTVLPRSGLRSRARSGPCRQAASRWSIYGRKGHVHNLGRWLLVCHSTRRSSCRQSLAVYQMDGKSGGICN